MMETARRWEETEEEFIRSHWGQSSDRDMAEALSRTEVAVTSRRAALRLLRSEKGPKDGSMRPWSQQDDASIREMFAADCSDEDMAIALGRTIGAVAQRRSSLRLLRHGLPERLGGNGWTDEQDMVLSYLFRQGKKDEQIGKAMDKTAAAIKDRRQTLGLWRAPRR